MLFLVFAACAPGRADWSDVRITGARLTEFDLSTIAVIGGAAAGDAVLAFDGPLDGAIPVHLGGGTLGAVLNLSIDPEGHDSAVEIDLADVRLPTVGDVLGTYRGSTIGGELFVGGSRRRMRNGRGASFREDQFEVGLGVWAGFEWVTVKEKGDETSSSTSSTPSTTPGSSTTVVDTGTPTDDSGALAIPAGDGEGCNCDHGAPTLGGGALVAAMAFRRRRVGPSRGRS